MKKNKEFQEVRLSDIDSPEKLKSLDLRQLESLAAQIRQELIHTVAENGGHLASNLGIVELTLAMHYVFDCPEDKIVFDVGHQSYVHKLLTGRYEQFHTLRQKNGLSGFPSTAESPYDTFAAGHASTAISAALGMARTRDIMGADFHVIAMLGDGALSGGMCYEALNDAGQSETRMIVILNDNEMSISRNVGAINIYLSSLRRSPGYLAFKRKVREGLEAIPHIGNRMFRFIERFRDSIKSFFVDGKFFEALGFVYIGPVDGHDLKHLIRILRRAKKDSRPILIHVVTQKGKGYVPAENKPDVFHGVAPFYVETGEARSESKEQSFGKLAGHLLTGMADSDIRICVVCAAMMTGTGMSEFAQWHPDRFFDVGIAEEHAVEMAAGMAASGMKPYVAIYSTFMQRSYDQIMIDVARNHLPVTFLMDRAGFVGADGATHQGLYDLSFMRTIPDMIIAVPRDGRELGRLLDLSQKLDKPMAIRYPKQMIDLGPNLGAQGRLEVGKWEIMTDGADVMIFAVGSMVQIALQAAMQLVSWHISCGVVDARFIKPMDEKMLLEKARGVRLAVTLEENSVCGGLGEAVLRILSENDVRTPVCVLGAPDAFVAHATVSEQREEFGLDADSVRGEIVYRFRKLNKMEEAHEEKAGG